MATDEVAILEVSLHFVISDSSSNRAFSRTVMLYNNLQRQPFYLGVSI